MPACKGSVLALRVLGASGFLTLLGRGGWRSEHLKPKPFKPGSSRRAMH